MGWHVLVGKAPATKARRVRAAAGRYWCQAPKIVPITLKITIW
jgi:hypothetical protein